MSLAAELATPRFCAACCEERRGLEPRVRPGANGKLRTVYLCVDCVDLGSLADLAQCETNDTGSVRTYGGMHRRGGQR